MYVWCICVFVLCILSSDSATTIGGEGGEKNKKPKHTKKNLLTQTAVASLERWLNS